MGIEIYREKIDQIDKNIGALLNERLNACKEIGKLKKQENAEVTDASREQQVLENVSAAADSEEVRSAISGIYEKIFEESKKLQT